MAPRGRPASKTNDVLLEAFLEEEAPRLTVLQPFLKSFPPIIARHAVKYFTGGAISPGTVANDDSNGKGPRKRYRLNGHIVYPAEYFLEYLERRGIEEFSAPNF